MVDLALDRKELLIALFAEEIAQCDKIIEEAEIAQINANKAAEKKERLLELAEVLKIKVG